MTICMASPCVIKAVTLSQWTKRQKKKKPKVVLGSRELKHFHDFPLFREMTNYCKPNCSIFFWLFITECNEFRATSVSGFAKQEKYAINRCQAKNQKVILYRCVAN